MKYFYAIIFGLMILVTACAQEVQQVQPQSTQPSPQPAVPTEETEIEVEEEVAEVAPSSSEVRVLTAGAFEPTELTINVGDSVTWINTDDKEAVIIIFKDGRTYTNSNKFKPGEQFENEFMEAGSYQYWRSVAFSSDGGMITVE